MALSQIHRTYILDSWLRRPAEKRTENDVLAFHPQVEDLLQNVGPGDSYQTLKSILKDHICN